MTAELAEAHRQAQLLLGALTVRRMQAIWALLDPTNLDASFDPWLSAVTPIITSGREVSATLAASYMSSARAAAGLGTFPPVLAAAPNLDALTTSMLVTGPVSVRSALGRRVPLGQAMATAEGRSAAAGMRWTLNGGRETVLATVKADPRITGWTRTTSSKSCDFCSMLAARGGVYSKESGDFPAHDGCACGVAPVYHR